MLLTMHKDTCSSSPALHFDWRPSSDRYRCNFYFVIIAECTYALILNDGQVLLLNQRKMPILRCLERKICLTLITQH